MTTKQNKHFWFFSSLSLKYEDSLIKKKQKPSTKSKWFHNIKALKMDIMELGLWLGLWLSFKIQPSAANSIWTVRKSLMYLLRVHQPYQYLVLWNFPLGLANIPKRLYFFPFLLSFYLSTEKLSSFQSMNLSSFVHCFLQYVSTSKISIWNCFVF